MANNSTSPFTPGVPVPVEFFVGRQKEIERLSQKMQKSLVSGPEVVFVAGERGIGKSSLSSYVRVLCEKQQNVLGIHTFMGGVKTVEEAVRKIFDKLLKSSTANPKFFKNVRSLLGKHVKEVDLFGLSLKFVADENELKTLSENFAPTLEKLLEQSEGDEKGILLIIDDINGLASSVDFANWLKSLVDEIGVTGRQFPVCIMLVGLEEKRNALIQCQPSLARMLDVIDISSWTSDETVEFFRRAFTEVDISCDDEALSLLAHYSGGLPMLAHELGDATFDVDDDSFVDYQDALNGLFRAAEIVGRKHVDPLVFDSIRSTDYRAILRFLAQDSRQERFSRSEAMNSLSINESKKFDNFLQKMKQLNVVSDDTERGRGCYRFTTRLHYLYLVMEAKKAEGASGE